MRIKSVKFNFIMNFFLTVSQFLFPLITFPYVSRVLKPAGTGSVAFATSVITYFTMFAMLGVPTYGIRACARVRENKEELSKTVQELLIINVVMMLFCYVVFGVSLFSVDKFQENKMLLLISSTAMLLNVIGVSWLYSALEQYTYITTVAMVFKVISIALMFAFVHTKEDYIIYGGITVFANAGSYVLNFIRLRKFISLKLVLPVADSLLTDDGHIITLIKPQFEVGKGKVGKKGVVREASLHREVVQDILEFARGIGLRILGLDYSPITGPEGNIEFLAHFYRGGENASEITDGKALAENTVKTAHDFFSRQVTI